MSCSELNSLFYTAVLVQGKAEIKGMLDTGTMATTLSADVVCLKQMHAHEGSHLKHNFFSS